METRLRAAIFEDDIILSGVLEDVLVRFGFDVVACVCSLSKSLETASAEPFDLAVVDLDLRGELAYPLLDELSAHRIPFVIATGTDPVEIVPPYDRDVVLYKPYSIAGLREALSTLSERVNDPLLTRLRMARGHWL